MIITVSTQAACLGDCIATAAAFDPAATYVGLYASVVNNGQNTILSNVTPCTGALATRIVVAAWSAAYLLVNGSLAVDGHLAAWTTAVNADAQTVAGYYFATALTGGNLIGFAPISPAIAVPYPYGRISILPRLVLTTNGVTDASDVIDG